MNSKRLRNRLEMQGLCGYSDAQLAEFGPWLRLATGFCAAWAAAATAAGSHYAIWALVPVAVLGAALPHHPIDMLYNWTLRRLTGTRPIPPHHAPRRFGCGVALVWLTVTGAAFYAGYDITGYALGFSMALLASVPTLTDFCIPSFIFEKLVHRRPACRDAQADPAKA